MMGLNCLAKVWVFWECSNKSADAWENKQRLWRGIWLDEDDNSTGDDDDDDDDNDDDDEIDDDDKTTGSQSLIGA